MSERNRKGFQKDQPSPQIQAKPVFLLPPRADEDQSPPMCTNYVVSAVGETIRVEFYYLSESQAQEALAGKGADVSQTAEAITVRLKPLARLNFPMTVAMDLAGDILKHCAAGLPAIMASQQRFQDRMAEVSLIGKSLVTSGEPAAKDPDNA